MHDKASNAISSEAKASKAIAGEDIAIKANASLMKIAKGAGIAYVSNMLIMFLGFVSGVIIVRSITQFEYGIYSIAMTVIGISSLIASMGLGDGLTRYIAYFRGTGEISKAKSAIISSLQIAVLSGAVFMIISVYASPVISIGIFGKSELLVPLKLLAVSIPFSVMIDIYNAVFKGFNRVLPGAYFSISRALIFILAIAACALSGPSLDGMILAYILAIVITCVAFTAYTTVKFPFDLCPREVVIINPLWTELLSFSVPLLAVNMLIMVLLWTDTLMIGYFKTPDLVGLYSIAPPLASLNILFLTSLGTLYTPIAARLYGSGKLEEMKNSYAISTKWCFIISFPLISIFLMFPDAILNFLYGAKYAAASGALQILTLGILFNSATGPNSQTLIAIGRSNVIIRAYFISSVINIALNILLIPRIGIVGAAIATALSIAIANLVLSAELYRCSGAHPITPVYAKSIILSVIVASPIYIISISPIGNSIWAAIISFALAALIYAILILATKTFDDEDIMIIRAIRKSLTGLG